MIGVESTKEQELEINPRWIVVATSTFYPKWYPGKVKKHDIVDKVRGDLAIEMFREATLKGYQVIVVDHGESPESFKTELTKVGVTPQFGGDLSMTARRQQAFREASKLEGVRVICYAEPEKVSIVRDCLPDAVLPLIQGKADIVIPKRDETAFRTYPNYQVEYEKRGNRLWNTLLREHNLMPKDAEDLDVWFGPRFFRNDPNILNLFLRRYEFKKRQLKLDQIVDLTLWPNSIFLPVVAALHEGFRVLGVNVPYKNPTEQTRIETDSQGFRRKRDIQYKSLIISTIHFIKMFENNSRSRIKSV